MELADSDVDMTHYNTLGQFASWRLASVEV